MQSMIPALWMTVRDIPGGATALLDGVWVRLVGQPLCYKTQPVALSGKTLLISVSNVAWQRTLERMSDLLVERINDICGDSCVEKVSFQVAPIARVRQRTERHRHRAAEGRPQEFAGMEIPGDRIANLEIAEALKSMVSRYL